MNFQLEVIGNSTTRLFLFENEADLLRWYANEQENVVVPDYAFEHLWMSCWQ